MGDKETEAPPHNEATESNAASDNKECMDACPKEGADFSQEHTSILNVPKDTTSLVDGDRGECQQEETTSDVNIPDGAPAPFPNEGGDMPAIGTEETTETTDHDVDIPDGAPDPLLNEGGDTPAIGAEETTETPDLDDGGNLEEPLAEEAPPAEQTVPETEVETIGPQFHEQSAAISDLSSSVKGNNRSLWIAVAFAVALVAVLSQQLLQPKDPPQKANLRQIDIFHQEMAKVKVQFPSQREDLWKRSKIHLQRHFYVSQPTEPISIILTAGVRAEATLRCLAQSIASALSSALNASVLHLDGAGRSSQDSDTVKSDIDSQLQKAFEGSKPIAVIHRFEELPPASTLIFYRYCDHENAAFKKTFLIFTVLLEEEEEIQEKMCLSEVEEMVTDHLQKKFLSHGHPSAFDKMDIDKYGGLWSRISHLILPVATEERIETSEQC